MHVITIDPLSRVLISTRFVPELEAWDQPHARLQLRTDAESGVILDFSDLDSLQMLASAVRGLLADYRLRVPSPLRRPRPPQPEQTHLFF
jgi:hypothetical protein